MSSNGRKRKNRGFIKYNSYLFVDKDPVMEALHTAVDNSGMSYREIHDESNVSTATIRNWFYGSTRRPQFCTVAAVARAVGKPNITLKAGGVRLSD